MTVAIGIDIGGSSIKGLRLDVSNEGVHVQSRARRMVDDDHRSREGMGAILLDLINELDPSGQLPLGLAVPGAIRKSDRVIVSATNFPDWEEFDIAKALGRPVAIGNDATLFAYGEFRAGAGRGRESLVAVTLGTGLGGGLVIDGRLHEGDGGAAGEIGHLNYMPDGEVCGCGRRGCLEAYTSTVALRRIAIAAEIEGAAEQNLEGLGRYLAQRADEGDEEAQVIFADFGYALGIGLGGLLNVLDVETLVVGGGLAAARGHFGAVFEATLKERVFADMADRLQLSWAKLGGDGGGVGAALLALDGQ